MKKLKIISVLLCAALLISFTGCNNIKQLNERLVIKGIGIDFEKEDKQYEITLMYLASEASESGSGTNSTKKMTLKGKTVIDCLTSAISKTGQEPLYSHNLFIIFGDELLKEGIWDAVEFFTKYYETRPTVNMFAAETTAKEVLELKDITPEIIDNLAKTERSSGRTAAIELYQYVSDAKNKTQRSIMPNLKVEEDTLQVNGSVLFKDRKKVLTLDGDESLAYLILTGRASAGTEVITTEKDKKSFTLSKAKSKMTIYKKDGLCCEFNVSGEAELYERNNDEIKEEDDMKKVIDKEIKNACEKLLKKVVTKKQIDIFNIGRSLRQTDNEFYESIEDWDKELEKSDIKVNVDIYIN